MSTAPRIFVAVVLATVVYGIWAWYTTRNVDPFDINSQLYAGAEPEAAPIEAPLTRVVSPGGPGAPNQAPPRKAPIVVQPPEKPYDPQEQSYESSDLPERLRHPERAFGPGIVGEDTESTVAAGTASYATQKTEAAYQTFSPEFAQNGGMFMDGIMANDTSIDLSYSVA